MGIFLNLLYNLMKIFSEEHFKTASERVSLLGHIKSIYLVGQDRQPTDSMNIFFFFFSKNKTFFTPSQPLAYHSFKGKADANQPIDCSLKQFYCNVLYTVLYNLVFSYIYLPAKLTKINKKLYHITSTLKKFLLKLFFQLIWFSVTSCGNKRLQHIQHVSIYYPIKNIWNCRVAEKFNLNLINLNVVMLWNSITRHFVEACI